jgi:hypothetical protein
VAVQVHVVFVLGVHNKVEVTSYRPRRTNILSLDKASYSCLRNQNFVNCFVT